MHNKYVILDTETTGLYPEKGDRIIEISMIKIYKNKILKKFHSFFNVKKKISKSSYKIHNIKNSFLKKKKYFHEKINLIDNFIKKSIIVSHNAKFDIKFLKKEYEYLKKKRKFYAIDTLKIVRKIFPGKKNTLKKICERFKIKKLKMHSAINDAKILTKIFFYLKNNQYSIKRKYLNGKV
ncbi:3'-5' exonuclease [Candidatus Vidania fulgoroideorum]